MLLYIARTELRFTEEEFWKCQPRKFFALTGAKRRLYKKAEEQSEKENTSQDKKADLRAFASW